MSQHPTLKVDKVGVKHRNVLTRLERVKKMQGENQWGERASIYNLPKIKSMKIKVKKTKEAPAEGAAAAPGAAAPAGAATAAKTAAPAKGAAPAAKAAAPAAKTAEKKK